MTAVITRQKPGHWADSAEAQPTTYEEPVALPVPRKERKVHGYVWITALLMVAVGACIAYAIKHWN